MMDITTIQKRIETLEKLEEEVRVAKEMLKGELENEDAYLTLNDEVKAVVAKRKQLKDEILSKGPNQKVMTEIKENQEEISTLKEILSAELVEFYTQNNTDEIANRKFKVNVRLLPKKGEYRNNAGQYTNGE